MINATCINNAQTNYKYSICTLITNEDEYQVMLDSFRKKGFNDTNTEFLYIPKKYAHGYLTLSEDTIVTYLVKGEYNPDSEHSIVWDSIPEVKKIVDDCTQGCQISISDKDRIGK